MAITRTIAFGTLALTLGLLGYSPSEAQSLKDAGPPAEIPAAAFKGNQYVDSRGCVYIRAGIDGNVTWVPRVNQARMQICGHPPTDTATTSASVAAAPDTAPAQITLDPVVPVEMPEATAAVVPAAEPVPVAAPEPAVEPMPISPKSPMATPTEPARTAAVASPARSRSKPAAARQTEPRVVPLHVHLNRQNTTNVQVPRGYKSVWKDDRLNPHRAERTLAPAQVQGGVSLPRGYKTAWDDGRLNPMRGQGTPAGDAATDQIWQRELPRTLVAPVAPAPERVITVTGQKQGRQSPWWQPEIPRQPQAAQPVARVSSRSASVTAAAASR